MNIGIDLGGSHIAIGLVNFKNEIILKHEHNWTREEKENYTDSVEKHIKEYIHSLLDNKEYKVKKIGIGYPSKNIIDGVIFLKEKQFRLKEILENEFNIPVLLKNDVKCSATCEKKLGSLKDYNNCIFMTLGTGIGGAYFYKNKLVKPNKYEGFELGHIIINTDGIECKCGKRGCFEKYASMKVFRSKIEELFKIENLNSSKMFEIIESKEKYAEVNKIINEYIKNLSIGLTNIIDVFEPDCICIGGSFCYYEAIFLNKLKEELKKIYNDKEIPKIITAKYKNDAGIIGSTIIK